MSIFFVDFIVMNLHEECLIKYLINPLNLLSSTEQLIANNILLEKKLSCNNFLTQKIKFKYTRN